MQLMNANHTHFRNLFFLSRRARVDEFVFPLICAQVDELRGLDVVCMCVVYGVANHGDLCCNQFGLRRHMCFLS